MRRMTADTRVLDSGFSLNPPLILFALSMTLVTLGILAVYSASLSADYLQKQLIYAGAGLAALLACYVIDYRMLKRFALPMLAVGFVACALVLIPGIGISVNGARRWVQMGPFTIQPSEFAKLALIVYMAKMLAERRQFRGSFFSGLLPAAIVAGAFAGVIVIEPDFGAAAVIGAIMLGMWIAAEMSLLHIMGMGLAALPMVVLAFLSQPYRMMRLMAFMSPDSNDPDVIAARFQLDQSLIAVGSGGLWGAGLGESHQKFYYVTQAHTDFIFAIMGEELGFLRMAGIVLLFAALTIVGWIVAMRSNDLFGGLLASGLTLMIVVSAGINMGVVLGLLPTKGLVLPFISAGGSSLVVNMAGVGLLMNVARNHFSHESDVDYMS